MTFKLTAMFRKRGMRTCCIFGAASVLLWGNTLWAYARGGGELNWVVYCLVISFLAVLYYFYPRRAGISIEGGEIRYCDGFFPKKQMKVADVKQVMTVVRNRKVLLVDKRYRRMKINFVFDDMDLFLGELRRLGLSVKEQKELQRERAQRKSQRVRKKRR